MAWLAGCWRWRDDFVRNLVPTTRGYLMSRHFVWLTPLSNLMLFSAIGVLLATVAWLWPRRGGWLGPRLIGFLAVLPVLMVTSPRLYPIAWAMLAAGIASCVAATLERHAPKLRRRLLISLPCLLVLDMILAGWTLGGDWLRERRESWRPLPPGNAPNVLLITLDTVRADRVSLYGYERPTTPVLERLARDGIRFDKARATAPWTVPSHASIFTGRWPHELGVTWDNPLDEKFPTLAEYLGSRGYATAGFVGNTLECSYDRGFSRGFTHYEDYSLEHLLPFRTAWLVDNFLQVVSDARSVRGPSLGHRPLPPDGRFLVLATIHSVAEKGCGIDQSRICGLVVATARARTTLFRLPQLLRCSRPLRPTARSRLPLRTGTPKPGRFHLLDGVLGVDRQAAVCGRRMRRLAARLVRQLHCMPRPASRRIVR